MEQITEHLYYANDTCSVYIIESDDGFCLIDCGTDRVGRDLPVERVLLTHFHRDQCAAAPTWQEHGAEIFIPYYERRYFEEADLLRSGYDIYDNYTFSYPGFTVLEDITPAGYARDYECIVWRDLRFAARHLMHVGPVAVVSDRRYVRVWSKMAAPFWKAEVRFFPREELEEARAWLVEQMAHSA